MVKAAPTSAFVVAETDLLLEVLVIALDAPTIFGQTGETGEADVLGHCRKPVLGRLLLARGPFDQKPFFGPGLAAVEVAPGDSNGQARKARPERGVRPLPPRDRPPGLGRKADSKLLDLDWPMRRIAAQTLGRPPAARRVGLRRPGARAGRPYRGVRQNARDIGRPERRDGRAQIAVRAVACVHQHHAAGQACRPRPTDLITRNLDLALAP